MALTELFTKSKKILHSLLIVAALFLTINNSFAQEENNSAEEDTTINRVRTTTPVNTGSVFPENPAQGSKYGCDVESINWDPFPFTNQDMNWEVDNPVCLTYIATVYTAHRAISRTASGLCKNIVKHLATDPEIPGKAFSPNEAKTDIDNVVSCGQMPTLADKALCCGGVAAKVGSLITVVARLEILWGVAEGVHEKARICGRYWNIWDNPKGNDGTVINASVWTRSSDFGAWKSTNVNYTYNEYDGSYSKYLRDKYHASKLTADITNKEFRELLYDGIEYKTNADTTQGGEDKTCKNPWSSETRMKNLGYDDTYQRYYMRGAANAANFACERFLVNSNLEERQQGISAYECCTKKSKTNICIENGPDIDVTMNSSAEIVDYQDDQYEYKFCELGSTRCLVKDIWFDVYASRTHDSMICAKTYSVCPFNHNLGGGTDIPKWDSQGNLTNNCQFLKHCVKIPPEPYFRTTRLSGAYISGACYDLKGDSQNTFGFNNDLVGINSTNSANFSAPIAQCIHETLYNIFLNKAGHTVCKNSSETPTKDGKCEGGEAYKIGDDIEGQSFFEKLQNNFRTVIKVALTLAVMVMGYQILLGGQLIERKEMSMFVIKVGLIMFFALGTAWQDRFFSGVFKAPMILSNMFFSIDEESVRVLNVEKINPVRITLENLNGKTAGDQITIKNIPEIPELNNHVFVISSTNYNTPQNTFSLKTINAGTNIDGRGFADYNGNGTVPIEEKLDGCQFPRFDYSDSKDATRFGSPQYPPGKEYLRIWDTLDCKIAKSLDMVPGASVPTLLYIIAASFFTGGFGVVFSFAAIIFAIYLISIVIRALHMFLICTIAIVLLIYISPVMITLALFKKTNSMFKKWWSNLLGYSLQPLVLFAYLGILITIYNQVIIGDITYKGDGRNAPKQQQCITATTNSNNGKIVYTEARDSIYCIFAELGFDSNTVAQLGFPIPSLTVFEAGRINEIMMTMMKAAFLMFIFSEFFSKMATLASVLVGGGSISGISGDVVGSTVSAQGIDVTKAAGKTFGAISGFGDRGRRGGLKAAKSIGRKGASAAKSFVAGKGSKGKSVKDD